MKLTKIALTLALTMTTFASAANESGNELKLETKGGFKISTANKEFSFKIGGRMHLDYNSYNDVINKDETSTGSDLFFRRGRIEMSGHAQDWKYALGYNVIDGGSLSNFTTTYTGFGKLYQLTFGQQKENFGLEEVGSSKWITAIERSMAANAFDAGDNLGVKLHGNTPKFTYSAGVYKEGVDASDNSLDTGVTGRLVFRPIFTDNTVVHFGGAYTDRSGDFDGFSARLGVRGGEDKTANKVSAKYNSGLTGDTMKVSNVEFAAIHNNLHFFAEYYSGEITGSDVEKLESDGYAAQLGWIITGEQRGYKASNAEFDKVKPSGPNGAWEVFARVDGMDTSNNETTIDVVAEKATVATLGVNWYMTNNTKISMNYINVSTDQEIGGEDSGNAFATRLQVLF